MGRRGTSLLLAGVAALVIVAGFDAVAGPGGENGARPAAEPPPPPRETRTPDVDPALIEAGLAGAIVYADERCDLHVVSLPGRRDRDAGAKACTFLTSPGGGVAPAPMVPAPDGRVTASCETGRVLLWRDGRARARARGCAPAWRPDGTLTAIRSGEVVALRGRTLAATRLIARGDLRRAVGRSPWALVDPHAREVAWIDDETAAVIVSDPGRTRDDVIAIFRGRHLVGAPPFPYERLSGLRVSPRGSYVAARIGLAPGGLLVLDRRGELRPIPFRVARSIAWSRDERWSAAATATGIYVWETESRGNRFVEIPVRARDVFWR